MSPDGIEQLRTRREAARAQRAPLAPRHPRGSEEHHQEPEDARVSASEKPTLGPAFSASEKDGPGRPTAARVSASEKSASEQGVSASRKSGAPARRRGRPRGPERYTLSVRITAELDVLLSHECEASGDGPQTVVERALREYLDRQQRRRIRQANDTSR